MTTTMIERIPDAELEVMLVLWHAEKPLNVSEITGKFVACDKSEYKHRFSPIISEKAYRKGEESTMLNRFFGGSAKKMIASLLDTDGLSDKDLEEISALVKRKKGE